VRCRHSVGDSSTPCCAHRGRATALTSSHCGGDHEGDPARFRPDPPLDLGTRGQVWPADVFFAAVFFAAVFFAALFFAALFAAPQLAHVLGNPGIPASKKKALAQALIDRAGQVAPPLAKLILVLAEKDRLTLLPGIARAYAERVMDHLKIVRGDVTTAIPLTPETLLALERGRGTPTALDAVAEEEPTLPFQA